VHDVASCTRLSVSIVVGAPTVNTVTTATAAVVHNLWCLVILGVFVTGTSTYDPLWQRPQCFLSYDCNDVSPALASKCT
jgi:hypothetical protein